MSISFNRAKFVTSAFDPSQLIPDEGAEIAFTGRSNAGKSSAINCLVRQKNLCKTSKSPGRTQLINFFALDANRRLVDLPGYGFARVSKQMRNHWNRVLSDFLLTRQALRGLIVVVDIRRGITDLDQALIDMIDDRLPLHVLLTKSDKLSRAAVKRALSQVEAYLQNPTNSVSTLSTLNRAGVTELEQKCREWLDCPDQRQ